MAIPAEILLVNIDYVKKLTPLSTALDDAHVKAAMYVAQDKWIQPITGDSLMRKLKEDTADSSISGVYLTLRDEVMAKAIAWWTMVELAPNLLYKFDNGSMQTRISEDSQAATPTDMKEMTNRWRDNATYYAKRLEEYLCANSSNYPEYSNNVWPDRSPNGAAKGSATFVFSAGSSASSRSHQVVPIRFLPR